MLFLHSVKDQIAKTSLENLVSSLEHSDISLILIRSDIRCPEHKIFCTTSVDYSLVWVRRFFHQQLFSVKCNLAILYYVVFLGSDSNKKRRALPESRHHHLIFSGSERFIPSKKDKKCRQWCGNRSPDSEVVNHARMICAYVVHNFFVKTSEQTKSNMEKKSHAKLPEPFFWCTQ